MARWGPYSAIERRQSMIYRLARHSMPEPNTGCTIWTACINRKGYGRLSRTIDESILAHVASYQLVHGRIPVGFELKNICGLRCCINEAHWKLAQKGQTARDNAERKSHQPVCKNGHTYTPENTHITPEGYRRCRDCDIRHRQAAQERRHGLPARPAQSRDR